MPVLRSADHVGEHHRFQEIIVRQREDAGEKADRRTAERLPEQ